MRLYERMAKELGLPIEETGEEKSSPGFRKLIMKVMIKAKHGHVEFKSVVDACRAIGSARRSLPYKTSGADALVYGVMARLTRAERLALNALCGHRPAAKNEFGHLAPIHPLAGDWQHKLMGTSTKKQTKIALDKKRAAFIEQLEKAQSGELHG